MTGVRKRDDFRCPGLLCPKRLGFGEVLSCNGNGMVSAIIVPYVEIQPVLARHQVHGGQPPLHLFGSDDPSVLRQQFDSRGWSKPCFVAR